MSERSTEDHPRELVWCSWCGLATADRLVCDRCGSPMIERPLPQLVALLQQQPPAA